MNEFNGSPGPWEVIGNAQCGDYEIYAIVAADGSRTICSVSPTELVDAIDPHNARLIAAAPELLSACIQVRDYMRKMELDWLGKGDDLLDAAIAKALGAKNEVSA